MDERSARALIALDNRFYAEHAASFSTTRSTPWKGWEQVLRAVGEAGTLNRPADGEPLRLLDVACGNLRFERFCSERLRGRALEMHAVDSCPALAESGAAAASGHVPDVRVKRADILVSLLDSTDPLHGLPRADVVACFGFMHHVPSLRLRQTLMRRLIDAARPGGAVAISFWQFMDDPRLARKALESRLRAARHPPFPGFDALELEAGDQLLGWQGDPSAFRYCHHFTESEIDALAASTGSAAREIARFSADGGSGRLNRYLVLEIR